MTVSNIPRYTSEHKSFRLDASKLFQIFGEIAEYALIQTEMQEHPQFPSLSPITFAGVDGVGTGRGLHIQTDRIGRNYRNEEVRTACELARLGFDTNGGLGLEIEAYDGLVVDPEPLYKIGEKFSLR